MDVGVQASPLLIDLQGSITGSSARIPGGEADPSKDTYRFDLSGGLADGQGGKWDLGAFLIGFKII